MEAVRVADGTTEEGVTDAPHALLLGSRTIPLDTTAPSAVIEPTESTRVLRGGRMTVDYIGPAGSFHPVPCRPLGVGGGGRAPEESCGQVCVVVRRAGAPGGWVSSAVVAVRSARGRE